ncbi:MAG TPA: PAS domain S-box protein, partial [Tepidisphaeraceae bacterium]
MPHPQRASRRTCAWERVALWCALVISCVRFLSASAAKPTFQNDPVYLIDAWETDDGMPENSATAMVQIPDGYLWFGTFNGLVRFDGAAKSDAAVQRDVATRLTAPTAGPVVLPFGSCRVEFRYTGLSLAAPEKVRFRVRLDGRDAQWQDVDEQRVAYYHELPPGEYVFRVRAADNDGLWSDRDASLGFTVEPFFWQTLWFRTLVALGVLVTASGTVWTIMRRKVRRQEEQLANQHALRESEQRLSLAVEAANLGLWAWDVPNDRLWVSNGARALFGWEPERPLGLRDLEQTLHPDDREPLKEAIRRALDGTAPHFEAECRVAPPSGATRWIASRGQVEFDAATGKPARMRGVSVDVTARRQAEQALRDSENRFRMMADSAPVMLWIADLDKLCAFVNKGWLDFTGRSLAEELGDGWA